MLIVTALVRFELPRLLESVDLERAVQRRARRVHRNLDLKRGLAGAVRSDRDVRRAHHGDVWQRDVGLIDEPPRERDVTGEPAGRAQVDRHRFGLAELRP